MTRPSPSPDVDPGAVIVGRGWGVGDGFGVTGGDEVGVGLHSAFAVSQQAQEIASAVAVALFI